MIEPGNVQAKSNMNGLFSRPGDSNRRQFLNRTGMGIGALALTQLLHEEGLLAAPPKPITKPSHYDLTPKPPMFEPQARAVISMFMHGGPSHVDLFDPKPELQKRDGQDYPGEIVYSFVNRASKKLLGSPWKFAHHGQSGTPVSELLPHTAKIIDDVCVIRSMHTGHNGHEVSIRYFHGGIAGVLGRPTLGSWIVYGLGTENQNLPAYMVLTDPDGLPVDGVTNWSNGFMPPMFQGTVLRPREPRIFNLNPPEYLRGEVQKRNLAFLRELNAGHAEKYPGEGDLEARIASYELAARMQTAATDALDISNESEATKKLYGLDDPVTREYGTRCLIARRLVERGVRFVQMFMGGQPWDNHSDIKKTLAGICAKTDKPAAALVYDLKSRGLLDSTIVHWGGEIGRLPVTEGTGPGAGRDHNGQGFTVWLAGGGFKGGMTYGATDEFGHKAVENVVTPNDFQATLLNRLGLDHTKLLYQHNGREERLTSNAPNARVVKEILV